ncbi:hypothetical protein Tco_1102081 [Tanacetum coccineum]
MADLKFVDQHNMVACLEKTEENAEFHQIVDFLSTCSINYALTVSPTIYASYIEQFWNTATSKTVNSVKQIHAIVDGKAVVISESSVRSDLLFNDEDGIACLTNDEIFENLALMGYEQLSTKLTFQKGGDSVERTITTAASLVAAQDSANILKTQTTTRSERVLEKPNEPPIPEGQTSGSGEGSMEHTFELMDTVPPTPYNSPLTGGYTLGSDEGRLKLKELMAICIQLSKQVLDLEKEKDVQAVEILKLKQRVKKLERKRKSSISHPRRRRYRHVESSDIDLDEEDASKQGMESDKTKSIKRAKEKGVAIKDIEDSLRPIRSITTLQPLPTINPNDKDKGVLVVEEPEKPKKVKRRDQGLAQIESDAELTHEEELSEIDADHELAVRLTHEEQQKYTIEERVRLLAEFFERRKKQLVAERAEAIRNKPPTRTQKLYEREKKWIDDFKPIDDDSQQQAESTKKRPRADSEEESSKKQKLEEDNDAEKEELRDSMDVVPRDDVAIDVESLATKYPIVDWKTHILNENMMYYQIIRADGSSKNYKIFSEMLDDFDRQDVIDLHRLVNERYETTSPEGYDLLLWGDLKTLFEPNEEDEIWKNQQDYNLISWRLFDSCRVHVLLMNTGVAIYMMIEKKYPLT